jgi:DNA-binding NarL/FixJ family response regulator
MLDAGASGFLLKESDIDEVYTALFSVIDGKNYFSQELLQNLVNNIHNTNEKNIDKYNLTEREIEIINYICKGYSNIEIAEKMFVSKRTVEKHRANILSKTDIKNTASLVMFAIKNGIVEV